jgi:hypothetical protein
MTRRLINVRVTAGEVDALDHLAREVGCSRAEAIRVAVALAVDGGPGPVRRRVARRRRNAAMAEMRAAGAPWQEVGEAFGLSATGAFTAVQAHHAQVGDGDGPSEERSLRVVGG